MKLLTRDRPRALTRPGAGATRRRLREVVGRDRRMATKSKAKGGFLEIVKTIVYALLQRRKGDA